MYWSGDILKECSGVNINGKDYVPNEEKTEGMPYVLIRTKSAGVFVGYLKERRESEVDLVQSRRIFWWGGAAPTSQLFQEGVTKSQNCKFSCEEPEKTVQEVIEVTSMTEKAKKSIAGVPV